MKDNCAQGHFAKKVDSKEDQTAVDFLNENILKHKDFFKNQPIVSIENIRQPVTSSGADANAKIVDQIDSLVQSLQSE